MNSKTFLISASLTVMFIIYATFPLLAFSSEKRVVVSSELFSLNDFIDDFDTPPISSAEEMTAMAVKRFDWLANMNDAKIAFERLVQALDGANSKSLNTRPVPRWYDEGMDYSVQLQKRSTWHSLYFWL